MAAIKHHLSSSKKITKAVALAMASVGERNKGRLKPHVARPHVTEIRRVKIGRWVQTRYDVIVEKTFKDVGKPAR